MCTTNSADESQWRLRIDGSNGNLAVTITASTTGVFGDTTNTDSVSQAQVVNYMFDFGTSGAVTGRTASIENTGNAIYGGGGHGNTSVTVDSFNGLSCNFNNTTDSASNALRIGPTPLLSCLFT